MSTDKIDLDAEDLVEIEHLSERAKGIGRRKAITTAGRALVFVLPALATFTVSPSALAKGGEGSAAGMGGMDGGMDGEKM